MFRFYFYKARPTDELQVAKRCISAAADVNNRPSDRRLVRRDEVKFGRYENSLPRVFLLSLKGYAYLQMCLGQTKQARLAVEELLELDRTDKIAAKVLLRVRQCMGRRMSNDIDEARNWQGNQVDCACRAHITLLRAGGFQLNNACVNDRYDRRIDRFFGRNPELADAYPAHTPFEVRAIAAQFANVFLLPPLRGDKDETMRSGAVRRLPERYGLQLRNVSRHEVRMGGATRLEGDEVLPMASDKFTTSVSRLRGGWRLGCSAD